MGELFTAAIAPTNIVLTILLGIVLLYWLTVVLGALDFDSFDLDLSHDVDLHAPHDVHIGDASHGINGFFFGILRFFNYGQVPFMILFSIELLVLWSASVLCNHEGSWINPSNEFWIAALLFVPNLLISLFLGKLITAPLAPIFKKLDNEATAHEYSGQVGTLTTPASPTETGQARVEINGAVALISVRTTDHSLQKGDKILIIEESPSERCYIVQKMENNV